MDRKSRTKNERYCAWLAYDRRCAVMGIYIKLEDMHLDHVKPLALGGIDDWSNLIPVHKSINLAKGANKYGRETREMLAKKIEKYRDALQYHLTNKTSIPVEETKKIDLYTVEAEEILADLGPTAKWNIYDLRILVRYWIKYGIYCLEKVAQKIFTSVHSIKCKLASMNIWDATFRGQKYGPATE